MSRTVAPHRRSDTKSPERPNQSEGSAPIDDRRYVRHRWYSDSPDWTIMDTDAKSCADAESPRTRVPACTFHGNAMNQSALPAHPRAGSCVEIGESRRRASPGDDIAHGRFARNRVQYLAIRRMCLIISGYALRRSVYG